MWEKSLRRNTSITEKFRQTRRSGLDLSLSGISLIQRVVWKFSGGCPEVFGEVRFGELSESCRGVVGEFSGSFRGVFGGLSGDPGNRFPFIFIHGSHLGPFAIFLGPFAKIWGKIHLQGCRGLSGLPGLTRPPIATRSGRFPRRGSKWWRKWRRRSGWHHMETCNPTQPASFLRVWPSGLTVVRGSRWTFNTAYLKWLEADFVLVGWVR